MRFTTKSEFAAFVVFVCMIDAVFLMFVQEMLR